MEREVGKTLPPLKEPRLFPSQRAQGITWERFTFEASSMTMFSWFCLSVDTQGSHARVKGEIRGEDAQEIPRCANRPRNLLNSQALPTSPSRGLYPPFRPTHLSSSRSAW